MGRVKGTPNKITTICRNYISDDVIQYHQSGKMAEDMEALLPNERIKAYIRLMEFIIPKPQAINLDISGERQSDLGARLMELALANDNPK